MTKRQENYVYKILSIEDKNIHITYLYPPRYVGKKNYISTIGRNIRELTEEEKLELL